MDGFIQWGITIIVGILGVLAGRKWQLLDKRNEKDKETLKLIQKILPSNGSIAYIRDKNFGDYFDVDELKDIFSFIDQQSDPELTFINSELERKRLELLKIINKFSTELGLKSFPTKKIGAGHLNSIQRPEKIGDDKYKNQMDYFNKLSNDVCDTYDRLIKEAKFKLN